MKYWRYVDQEGAHIFSEMEIILAYYPFWSNGLAKQGKLDLITPENCIEDWVVVNWAEPFDIGDL